MDGDRFDALTRALGSGRSRRAALGALAGAALAAVGIGEAAAAKLRSVGNSCNVNSDCASGLCVQEAPGRKICHCQSAGDCPAATDVCHAAACLPIGYCGFTINTGVPCDDGLKCTINDVCQANGSCVGTPVVCTASDQCHTTGTCNPSTGVCSNPVKANGTACDDGNACTSNDVCTAGVCGGTTISCDDSNPCTTDACNQQTGCTHTAVADGTTCNGSGICKSGTCCTPATTCPAGQNCGTASDGCGGTLQCGTCNASQCLTCGPNHTCVSACSSGQTCNSGSCVATGICATVTCQVPGSICTPLADDSDYCCCTQAGQVCLGTPGNVHCQTP